MGLQPVNKKEGLKPKSLDITSFENADFGLLLQAEEWSTIRDTRNGGWVQNRRVRYWSAEIQKVVVTSTNKCGLTVFHTVVPDVCNREPRFGFSFCILIGRRKVYG
jgi:hypothetical protein